MLHSINHIKSVLSVFITIPLRMAEAAVASRLENLIKRLNEAERRAKLLKFEVISIRNEISMLRQNVSKIPNCSTGRIDLSAGPSLERSVVLLDDLPSTSDRPSTSSVDGFVSYKRPIEQSNSTQSKKTKHDFNKEDDYVLVYTDGACENNGKANAKAGIGVWFGDQHPLNISEPVQGRATNNTAEIQACVQALKIIQNHGEDKVKIYTDSEFTINCMTKWIGNWRRNNWKTSSGGDVKNKEDLQVLDNMIKTFCHVIWVHVAGHSGIEGNEQADKLARMGALRYTKTWNIC